jgi:hypothetical protein
MESPASSLPSLPITYALRVSQGMFGPYRIVEHPDGRCEARSAINSERIPLPIEKE